MQLENVLGPQRQKFVSMVARRLHEEQPWYHSNISREAADRIMVQSEHRDGKFLYVSYHYVLVRSSDVVLEV